MPGRSRQIRSRLAASGIQPKAVGKDIQLISRHGAPLLRLTAGYQVKGVTPFHGSAYNSSISHRGSRSVWIEQAVVCSKHPRFAVRPRGAPGIVSTRTLRFSTRAWLAGIAKARAANIVNTRVVQRAMAARNSWHWTRGNKRCSNSAACLLSKQSDLKTNLQGTLWSFGQPRTQPQAFRLRSKTVVCCLGGRERTL